MDLLENQITDLRMSFILLCYSPDFVSTPGWGTWGPSPPTPRMATPTLLGT